MNGRVDGRPPLISKTYTGAAVSDWETSVSKTTISANNTTNILPEGYTCIGIQYCSAGGRYINLYRATVNGRSSGEALQGGRNYHGSTVDGGSATLRVLYARNDLVRFFASDEPISLDGEKPCLIVKKFTRAYTSATAQTNLNTTAAQLSYSVPEGYKRLALAGFYSGHSSMVMVKIHPETTSNNYIVIMYNASSSARSGTLMLEFSFIREDLLEVNL